MKNSNAEHWITEPKVSLGQVYAYGVSAWDIKDGGRLRREMRRSTRINSVKEMKRWAKRYRIDVSPMVLQWEKLLNTDEQANKS